MFSRYSVMLSCWEIEAGQRPPFSDLVVTMNDLLERDAGYLELSFSPTCQMATIYPPPSTAHPEIELTEMTVFEPEAEKEDVSGNMEASDFPSTGCQ